MKKIRHIAFAVLLPLLLWGCTQNNGHIGPLFGSWHLESMSCDGSPLAQPDGTDTYWKFQGSLVEVILSKGFYETEFYTGIFTRDGQVLSVSFPPTNAPDTPQWMGFAPQSPLRLDIERLAGSEMNLKWTSDEGKVYIYNFKKTW